MRFSLAITHTPWIAERKVPFERLLAQVGPADSWYAFKIVDERAKNWEWSVNMWRWAASQDVTHCLFLQDDALLAPDFQHQLGKLVKKHQNEIIGLQVAHPAAMFAAENGHTWMTTADALVGVGYLLPKHVLEEFLGWRSNLKEGAVEAISEDTLVGLFALCTGRKIYHPLPTLVDHDVSVPSTYLNDGHVNRQSRCRWDSPFHVEVARPEYVPHMGRLFIGTPTLAQQWVPGTTDEDVRRYMCDNGSGEARKLSYAARARHGTSAPKAKLFIATPTRGQVHPRYTASLCQMFTDECIDFEQPYEILDVQQWSADVVRARSRFVNFFLTQTDATHLLFLDDDIEVEPKCIRGMLRSGYDFVAAPYPRREGVLWDRVRLIDAPCHPEALAYHYSLRMLPDWDAAKGFEPDMKDCVEMESVPLGCALLTRKACEDAVNFYASTLTFDDNVKGTMVPTVALFQLLFCTTGQGRSLLSEDFSFCERWRRMGRQVRMYLGPGSPVNHWGEHAYRGHIEAMGLKRVNIT